MLSDEQFKLYIYNSRNCLGHIDNDTKQGEVDCIYNSRNCLGHIDFSAETSPFRNLQ